MPAFMYDIRLLQKRMAFLGLHTAELARRVAAKAVLNGDKPPTEREVFTIMGGERPFPKPDYIRQIADALDVSMSDLVIENSTPEAA